MTRTVSSKSVRGTSPGALEASKKEFDAHCIRSTRDLESVREPSDWMSDPSIPQAVIGRVLLIIGAKNSEMSDESWRCPARAFRATTFAPNLEEHFMCFRRSALLTRPSLLADVYLGAVDGDGGDVSRHLPGVLAGAL